MEKRIVLDCQSVHHAYGDNHVLHDVNLKIVRGQIVALVGPSGCGKSTMLTSILGTLRPTKGQVLVYSGQAGEERTNASIVKRPGRDRGIVYQRYSLFPNLTALTECGHRVDVRPIFDSVSIVLLSEMAQTTQTTTRRGTQVTNQSRIG